MTPIIDPLYCSWDTSSWLLIFSDNVFGSFIYYSHLFPALTVGAFIFILLWQNRRDPVVIALSVMGLAFIAWSFIDLVLWATANPSHTMFFWSIIIHFELLVYIATLYFIQHYVKRASPHWLIELAILVAYIPLLLFTHTKLNLVAFDYTNCWREAIEGPLVLYVYTVELILAIAILFIGMKAAFTTTSQGDRRNFILATAGTTLFLFSFSAGNILGTFEIDWELGQYGLFAVPAFIGLLTYLIIRYKGVNVKLFGTEVLVAAITIMITSILFVRRIENVQVITAITLALILILGVLLIRSVRKEVKQREEIQKLAANLEKANQRLKQLDTLKSEFVSIASHQLRSPLASMMGYASMLRDGSYGKLPAKAQEAAVRIEDSTRLMAQSVEDYLNVSRIEAGHMKYNLTDFSLIEQAQHITDDIRPIGLKKGVVMLFRTAVKSKGVVNADKGKTEQIIHNLVNNSLKYTPQGTITVIVRDDVPKKRVYVDILDTGIGMSERTLHSIFAKFERGSNANSANIHGTGLGLYTAQKLAEAMGGTITARSEGEGKGSCFTLELPLVG